MAKKNGKEDVISFLQSKYGLNNPDANELQSLRNFYLVKKLNLKHRITK